MLNYFRNIYIGFLRKRKYKLDGLVFQSIIDGNARNYMRYVNERANIEEEIIKLSQK